MYLILAMSLNVLMGCTKPNEVVGYVDAIIDYPKENVDPLLVPYVDEFLEIASAHHGIDLSHEFADRVFIKFTDRDNGNVATSYGRDKSRIVIMVNRERFYNRTEQGRKYVMWHELGHDVLNLPHSDKGMMRATSYSGFFKEGVDDGRQTAYLYKSLNSMFKFYLGEGDGIQDSEWTIKVSESSGYTTVTITNKETHEFARFLGESGGVLIGLLNGGAAIAYLFDDAFVVRNWYNDEILLTIKL